MSTCPRCGGQHPAEIKNPPSVFRWLGVYTYCDECKELHYRKWAPRTLTLLIVSIVMFQFLASLIVLPALDVLIASTVIKMTVFTVFHLFCLPLYALMSMSFVINS